VVERNLAKVDVARSNRVTRFFLVYGLFYAIYHEIFIHILQGESGIRTHGNRKISSDFKSDAFDQLCHLSSKGTKIYLLYL
jgi:hypothetical protein